MRPRKASFAAIFFVFLLLITGSAAARSATACSYIVGYKSEAALRTALARHDATLVRRLPALHAAEVVARDVSRLRLEPGIRFVEAARARVSTDEPALALSTPTTGVPFEWQYPATRADQVPAWVQRAAASVTIAVIDTGADLTAPDLAAKAPNVHSVVSKSSSVVTDDVGHGTFVASLAAGSVTNGEGIAGFGGDAQLMIVKANRSSRTFDDADEASAIVWATDHGAKIVNLSIGGPQTSTLEQRAVDYAVSKGVLLVAAAGNSHSAGDPVEYPAALLQPVDSNGAPGPGLSVGSSDAAGARAPFSNAGSTVSLVAPGVNVLGAVSSHSTMPFQQIALPGSKTGIYGYGSGTSYSAPQVAGAAALVWGANPTLTAADVADILRRSAGGGGVWNPETGYGVLDVAKAVELSGATTPRPVVRLDARRSGQRVRLTWTGTGAASYRLTISVDGAAARVVPTGTATSVTYRLSAGHGYLFAAEALDEAGAVAGVSAPYRVSADARTRPAPLKPTRR